MVSLKTESIQADEPKIIAEIIESTIAGQEATYKPGTVARRDVHSKSHGTVSGALTVLAQTPADCQVGLFAQPATYRALVRFSNGTPGVCRDAIPNVRGIAIKVLGVAGEKLLAGDEDADCVDFLLANHPISFLRNLDDYPPIHDLLGQKKFGQVIRKYPRSARLLVRSMVKLVKNPLTITYYSQTPYLLGDGRVVKYALVPKKKSSLFAVPNVFDAEYLRHAVENTLRTQAAEFTLCVQFQEGTDPIEDPSQEWRGPFVPVAELVIEQRSNEPLLESDGEALSFNPWRTLSEHRPLGWVNRVREAVYRADFAWRTAKNAEYEIS